MKENEFGILMYYTNYCGCECIYGGIENSKFIRLVVEKYQ